MTVMMNILGSSQASEAAIAPESGFEPASTNSRRSNATAAECRVKTFFLKCY